jgi:hypothetical protein
MHVQYKDGHKTHYASIGCALLELLDIVRLDA